jgi:hypothetical protein
MTDLKQEITYDTHVRAFADRFVKIKMTDAEIRKANHWVIEMQDAKLPEFFKVNDFNNAHQRIFTGVIGEMAIEKYIGKEFIDWSIGEAVDYQKPDLSAIGLDYGVKTVLHGKFPIIYKQNTYPQIFVVYRYTDQTAFVCGTASVEVLNQYQSDDLVISPFLKAKKIKTGFYGFGALESPSKLLENIDKTQKHDNI